MSIMFLNGYRMVASTFARLACATSVICAPSVRDHHAFEADAALARAKAEMLQIRIEEKKRTLVPVEAYDTMIDEFAGVVLSALGSLPARCAPRGDLATRRAIERAVWLSPCRDRNRRPADGRRERRAIRTSAAICSRCERARFRRAIRHRRAGGDQ
jgi:hypothetical protein